MIGTKGRFRNSATRRTVRAACATPSISDSFLRQVSPPRPKISSADLPARLRSSPISARTSAYYTFRPDVGKGADAG